MPLIYIGNRVIPINKKETVLSALLRENIPYNYQCKDGYCGSCRVRAHGFFYYTKQPIAYKTDNEILACCAIPLSDMTLFIDDV